MAMSHEAKVINESSLLDRADRYWLEVMATGLALNALLPASGLGAAIFVGGTILGLHRLARKN